MVEPIKLNTKEEIQTAVNEFANLKPHMRMTTAFAINKKLQELAVFVNVLSDNPILKYPSDRFIIQNKQDLDNNYDRYVDILQNDIDRFNDIVYGDIDLKLDDTHGMNDVICTSNSLNDKADSLILGEYPEMKDYMDITKMATSKILSFFKSGTSTDILKTSLDDIEFIISTGMMPDEHVRRYLLPVMKIREMSLYRNMLDEQSNRRLTNIFNTQISLVKHRRDEFMRLKPFNDGSLEAYLKIQKQSYEQTLVDQEISSDYDVINHNLNPDIDLVQEVYNKYIIMNKKVTLPRMTDIFRLQQNGFDSLTQVIINDEDKKPVTVNVYVKHASTYLILKSKKDKDTFFFIAKHGYNFKNFKVKFNNEKIDNVEMDALIESTFLNPNKMNRV